MRFLHLAALGYVALAACTSSSNESAQGATTSGGAVDAGAGGEGPDAGDDEEAPPLPTVCDVLGMPEQPFAAGPYGNHRHELADDFTLPLTGGAEWSFKKEWTGCETYVFIPDTLVVSDLDATSIWEKDLTKLVEASPHNVHYFFVSRKKTDEDASASTSAMAQRVTDTLGGLSPEEAEHWRSHLHVVSARVGLLESWVGDVMSSSGVGWLGFGIDRTQRIRGIGGLADVKRYSTALNDAGKWPWKANLAYAVNEVNHYNFEADRDARLAAEDATLVTLWSDEVLAEFAEKDIELPPADEIAKFDTLEIDVTANCPDPDAIEAGNCGAWDYLAYLFVQDETGANVELGRFITTYHREGRWIVDASPMLALLSAGGTRHFRWEFAPSWNTQPTATTLSLRFSNQRKGYKPAEATHLWGGGAFSSTYNDARLPIDVTIPEDAKRVELWAIITGHGAAAHTCAEFCNHQHQFTVNGAVYLDEFPGAGTDDGCLNDIAGGTVPNQWGTWWFGRGGWCPGKQVDPYVVDVTADAPPGSVATVSYEGLFNGQTPEDGSGDIVMTSYLVVYR